ncbi:MAG: S46 family peptidase [Edaphocola sp.]
MIDKQFRVLFAGILAAVSAARPATAKEGMWQPPTLERQHADMRKLGLKIPVSQLYNDNGTGLNNAVVLFGKGCTGELVSANGLLFTNHHCGYGTAQSLSDAKRNILKDGFWAKNNSEELPCPGLTVSVVRRIDNVTDFILKDIDDTTPEDRRRKLIAERTENLRKAYKNLYGFEADIKPYYNGNEYWASLCQEYTDIRLVGFPPNGIGKFGADTDNWMWPRETGDFSIFRIYANAKNEPAPYDTANKPYRSNIFFPINTGGYKEGDFTMVYGFPAQTREYISSYELNQVQYISDPIRIEARNRKLAVWDDAMRADDAIFLKYAAKQSSLSNGYKKWQGEVKGLSANDVLGKKQRYEQAFQQTATLKDSTGQDPMILPRLQAATNGTDNALATLEYTRETVLGVEAIAQAAQIDKLLLLYRKGLGGPALADSLAALRKTANGYFKNYDALTDRKVFDTLMPLYFDQADMTVAPEMKQLFTRNGSNFKSWAANIFNTGYTTDAARMNALLQNAQPSDTAAIKQDAAWQIYHAVQTYLAKTIDPTLKRGSDLLTPLNRIYMQKQMAYNPNHKDFYPDANQTLRLSYGDVAAIDLGESNIFQTNLNDLMRRNNPMVEEFDVPKKLQQLYQQRDYGRWGANGTVPVCFIARNHTSGGNSGSPTLNGKGELIGINFDRIWQGTMSDLYFDPKLCRNVSVDIRYVLFVIEKFGGAGWLLNEMKLVR